MNAPHSILASAARAVPAHVVAVLPTYDNAGTLTGVIEAVLALDLPVVVVNDGATDGTAAVLAAFADRIAVVIHETNQGKAAALQSGFAWAVAHGYTHAATIDTDAQHDPADLLRLADLARQTPAALVLGVRRTDIAGYPKVSRLGRWAANVLVRWESGLRVADSQCGLRVYPLAAVTVMSVRSDRYGYETEVLTRAAWAGVPVIEADVACVYAVEGGRVSHFRPWRDSTRSASAHVRLLALAALRWLNPSPAWQAARRNAYERSRFAAAVAVGVFIGNLPLFGLHTVLSVIAAKRLRLQPLAVIAGSHISTPPAGPLLIALAIAVGHLVVHGRFIVPADLNPATVGYVECLRRVALEWTVGSVVCGVVLGLVAYVLVQLIVRFTPSGSLSRYAGGGLGRGSAQHEVILHSADPLPNPPP